MIEKIKDLLSFKPYKEGLALSGGGAKGFSHIGALKALLDYGFKPEIVSGVSAGSIVGALYCDGKSPEEIIDIFSELSLRNMVKMKFPRKALLSMDPFLRFLEDNLRAKCIEELQTPLIIQATDLDKGKIHRFRSGNLIDVICASCSIPGLFAPKVIGGVSYVDGGVLQNFPVSALHEECRTVLGINVTPIVADVQEHSLPGITFRAFRLMAKANSREDKKWCDLLIEPEDIDGYNMFDVDKRNELIQIGYRAAVVDIEAYMKKKK